jgi:general secretion pathway protein A
MYAQSFGLRQDPFSIAPDPSYLFMSERHREALAHLLYGVGGGGGFVLLTGEIGTGKTTVCRCFLEQIPADCNVAYIFNPKLTVHELLQSVCDEFGVAHAHRGPGQETAKDCIDPLNAFLLRTHAAGQHNVLIIDEAQNLSADVLEQLRLLTNLETNERKLLQIVLIGQPQLRRMVAHPKLEQLAQRVIARYHLDALSREETAQYVAHRLAVAGLAGPPPFDRRALARIHRLTGGVPRRINLLCGRALLGAYACGQRTVTRRMVDRAAREVFDAGDTPAGQGLALGWMATAALALVAAGVLITLGAVRWSQRDKPAAALPATRAPAVPAASSPSAPRPVASARAAPLVGAPLPAQAASRAAPVAPLPASDISGVLLHDESEAWRILSAAWHGGAAAKDAAADERGDPCAALQRQATPCFRTGRASLNLIRQLDRPGIMTVYGEDGKAGRALLTGLTGNEAVFTVAGGSRTVALDTLAAAWRGEFATLWRAPAGYSARTAEERTGPLAAWLASRLAMALGMPVPTASAPDGAWIQARLRNFQLAQGLTPDGMVGPITLMQLNRATGVEEPRLQHTEK